jgi:ubiquinone biosynthesis monooxygenase Coq7
MEIVAKLNRGESLGDRILKVNHAGENGAINIYRGQVFVSRLRAPSLVPDLREFQSHEEGHRSLFWAELERRGRPRCRSYHLCGAGGLALGIFTGILGPSAVAATTVAVESVVLRHLEAQLVALRETDAAAHAAISAIVREEREHHDRAAAVATAPSIWVKLLTPVVSVSTEVVIWLGMRL